MSGMEFLVLGWILGLLLGVVIGFGIGMRWALEGRDGK